MDNRHPGRGQSPLPAHSARQAARPLAAHVAKAIQCRPAGPESKVPALSPQQGFRQLAPHVAQAVSPQAVQRAAGPAISPVAGRATAAAAALARAPLAAKPPAPPARVAAGSAGLPGQLQAKTSPATAAGARPHPAAPRPRPQGPPGGAGVAQLTKSIRADAETKRRIALANRAISHAQRVIVHGAGNIEGSIRSSKGKAARRRARARRLIARKIARYERRHGAPPPLHVKKAIRVKAIRAMHGGNCGEFADLVFHWLLSNAPNGEIVNRVSSAEIDHGFVILGDLDNEAATKLVVADAWPTHGSACRWTDFFLRRPQVTARDSVKNVITRTVGGRQANEYLRNYSDVSDEESDYSSESEDDSEVDEIVGGLRASDHLFNNQWSNRYEDEVKYL